MRNQADTAAVEKRNDKITHLTHVREVEKNPSEGEKEYRIQVGQETGGGNLACLGTGECFQMLLFQNLAVCFYLVAVFFAAQICLLCPGIQS